MITLQGVRRSWLQRCQTLRKTRDRDRSLATFNPAACPTRTQRVHLSKRMVKRVRRHHCGKAMVPGFESLRSHRRLIRCVYLSRSSSPAPSSPSCSGPAYPHSCFRRRVAVPLRTTGVLVSCLHTFPKQQAVLRGTQGANATPSPQVLRSIRSTLAARKLCQLMAKRMLRPWTTMRCRIRRSRQQRCIALLLHRTTRPHRRRSMRWNPCSSCQALRPSNRQTHGCQTQRISGATCPRMMCGHLG